jgi:hypothetical protein
VLLGTASTWFFLDVAYYSQTIFLPNVLADVSFDAGLDNWLSHSCVALSCHQPFYTEALSAAAGRGSLHASILSPNMDAKRAPKTKSLFKVG